jgi:hypothetical protein
MYGKKIFVLAFKYAQYCDNLVGIATELRAGRSGDRIPVGGELFRTRPNLPPCGAHPALLYSGYRVFTGVKRPGRVSHHPPPSSAEVEGRLELYIYFPSGISWPVLG